MNAPDIHITDLATAFDLSPETVNHRRKLKWKWTAILLTPLRGQYTGIYSRPEQQQVQYREHKSLCHIFNVQMNVDDVLEVPTRTAEVSISYHALARDFRLPTTTLIERIKSGWGWRDALTTKPRSKKK